MYCPALRGEFVYDDLHFISKNYYIRHLKKIPAYFTDSRSVSLRGHSIYRPLRTLAYAADYTFWKMRPDGYHLHSLLLHIANGLLVSLIACNVTRNRFTGFLAGTVFMTHPLQVESVAWIASRGDLLGLFFCLLCVWLQYHPAQGRLRVPSCTIPVLFALSLLSKETGAAIILFWLFQSLRKSPHRLNGMQWLLCIGVLCMYFPVRYGVLGEFAQRDYDEGKFMITFAMLPQIACFAMAKFFLPIHLAPIYHFDVPHGVISIRNLTCLAIVIVFILSSAYLLARNRQHMPVAVWILSFYLPTANVIPIRGHFSDHFLYYSMAGLAILIAGILRMAARRVRPLRHAWIPLVLMLAALSFQQSRYWKNTHTLFKHTLAITRDDFRPYVPAILEKILNKEFDSARRILLEGASASYFLQPKDIYTTWSILERHGGNDRLSYCLAKQLLRMDGNSIFLLTKLAKWHMEDRHITESKYYLRKILDKHPFHPEPYSLMGRIEEIENNPQQALRYHRTAVEIDPENYRTQYNLGVAFTHVHKRREAIRAFQLALQYNPGFASAHKNLGILLLEDSRPQEAYHHLQTALDLDENIAQAELLQNILRQRSAGHPPPG